MRPGLERRLAWPAALADENEGVGLLEEVPAALGLGRTSVLGRLEGHQVYGVASVRSIALSETLSRPLSCGATITISEALRAPKLDFVPFGWLYEQHTGVTNRPPAAVHAKCTTTSAMDAL